MIRAIGGNRCTATTHRLEPPSSFPLFSNQHKSRMHLSSKLHPNICITTSSRGLAAAVVLGLVIATPATASTEASGAVPDDVRALVASTDTLLAYKTADMYADGTRAAVIVIRHPSREESSGDFDTNSCELIVLHEENGKLREVDHSTKAVDCTYNDTQRHAPAMSLHYNLTVSPGRITYVNQRRSGWSSFEFSWSKTRNTWYLWRETTSNPGRGTNFDLVKASYPDDFGWTPMSALDPDALAEALDRKEATAKPAR